MKEMIDGREIIVIGEVVVLYGYYIGLRR